MATIYLKIESKFQNLYAFICFCFILNFGHGQASMVEDINPDAGESAFSVSISYTGIEMKEIDGNLFFRATDGVHGWELWKYDGSDLTMFDINPLPGGDAAPTGFTKYGSDIIFRAENGVDGNRLWKFDGDQTIMVQTNVSPTFISPTNEFELFNNNLYFRGLGPTGGSELWAYNGVGAYMVENINPWGSSFPNYLTATENFLFLVSESDWGRRLCKYDMSEVSLVDDVNFTNYPKELTLIGDTLYFVANSDVFGQEVWKTDGVNTSIIDINPGLGMGSSPSNLTVWGTDLYFSATDLINGVELWKYDGDTAMMVQDINPNGDSDISNMVVFDDQLYFVANDGVHREELWKYDGDTAVLVKDIHPWNDSDPRDLIGVNSFLYFTATDGVHGRELWKYDGDTVLMVQDINLDGSSNPRSLTAVGSLLYFVADDGIHGRELWVHNSCSSSSTDVIVDCNEHTWINGVTYTSSNNSESYTTTNAAGCDSVVFLNLTINSISDTTVEIDGNSIMVNNSNATYQWLDCNNDYELIQDENDQIFLADNSGNYAVEITENGCTDTTDCFNINPMGLDGYKTKLLVSVYPNPNNGLVHIDFGAEYSEIKFSLTDMFGKSITEDVINSSSHFELNFDYSPGIYFLKLISGRNSKTIQLVKQ